MESGEKGRKFPYLMTLNTAIYQLSVISYQLSVISYQLSVISVNQLSQQKPHSLVLLRGGSLNTLSQFQSICHPISYILTHFKAFGSLS